MTNQTFLPYGKQHISDKDIETVVESLKAPFLTTGPKIAEFEKNFSTFIEVQHSIAVANGTAALHLACLALEIGPGDVVLTPSMSFAASTNAAVYCGATIEFMDCDPGSGLITPQTFLEAVRRVEESGKKPRVAIIVHLNGEHADMADISAEAEKQGIHLIEDACHALGTEFEDESGEVFKVGACRYSSMTAFSTHPVKTITTGEGGLITTQNETLAKKLLALRNHGIERNPDNFEHTELAYDKNGEVNVWYHEVQTLGYNYRLTDIACALGISQLARMDYIAKRRRQLVTLYNQLIEKSGFPIHTIPGSKDSNAVRHLYPILLDYDKLNIERNAFAQQLHAKGVGTQVHYIPTHLHPLYRKSHPGLSLPGAEEYYRQVISLPLYPELTDENVEYVIQSIGEILSENEVQ